MVDLRVQFQGENIGRQLKRALRNEAQAVRAASRGALVDVRRDFLERARPDILQSGNFGRRWTQGLQGEIIRERDSYTLQITHDIPYFMVHQRGALIRGRPLLWIPLSWTDAARNRVWARDYPGGLFRVDREGKSPLLFSRRTKEPIYSGHEQVRIPKRFHTIEILRDSTSLLREFYVERFRAARRAV